MRREQFAAYLARLDGQEPPTASLSRRAGLAARIEESLGFSLDNADLSAQGIAALMERLRAEAPDLSGEDGRAALEAYGRFMAYAKAR